MCIVLYSNIPLSYCPTVGGAWQYFERNHISHSQVLTHQETYGPLSPGSLSHTIYIEHYLQIF